MNQQLDLEDLNDNTIYYEDLEIGDYVRFIDYDMINTGQEKVIKIGQVEGKYSDILEIKLNNNLTKIKKCTSGEIIKYNKELKELVEKGDYVNGYRVDEKTSWGVLVHKARGIDKSGFEIPIVQYKDDIKLIVTKEQMESISYKVGD